MPQWTSKGTLWLMIKDPAISRLEVLRNGFLPFVQCPETESIGHVFDKSLRFVRCREDTGCLSLRG